MGIGFTSGVCLMKAEISYAHCVKVYLVAVIAIVSLSLCSVHYRICISLQHILLYYIIYIIIICYAYCLHQLLLINLFIIIYYKLRHMYVLFFSSLVMH